jgi:hypothetical protein
MRVPLVASAVVLSTLALAACGGSGSEGGGSWRD